MLVLGPAGPSTTKTYAQHVETIPEEKRYEPNLKILEHVSIQAVKERVLVLEPAGPRFHDEVESKLPENVLKPAGLKENKKTVINTPDQKETVQDDENKNKSENSEVKNEELTDQKVNEQTFATVNGTSNKEVTDNNKILNNKEV